MQYETMQRRTAFHTRLGRDSGEMRDLLVRCNLPIVVPEPYQGAQLVAYIHSCRFISRIINVTTAA